MSEKGKNISIDIKISSDKMKAYLNLRKGHKIDVDDKIELNDVLTELNKKNVVYGIYQDEIQNIIKNPSFGRDYIVAEGKNATEGIMGRYEFLFNSDFSKKPKELPDGSVDYMSIKVIETVGQGDKIAIYHPAKQGENGINVLGKIVIPKKVRDLAPLSGKGFSRSLDGNTYIADFSGKIEKRENKITISPVYEVNEEVGVEIGDIEFFGDVIIHSSVTNGATVKAKGNITVDGFVENCTIKAFGDIILLKGVKGSERTVIEAYGNITAEYIEYSEVSAKGDIIADVIFKSDVNCSGLIKLEGKRKHIVGGHVSSVEGISAGSIGNKFGVITDISVGLSSERRQALLVQEKKVDSLTKHLKAVEEGLDKLDKILKKSDDKEKKSDPRKIQLLRAKLNEESVLMDEKVKLSNMRNILEKGKKAKIYVKNKVYQGVTLNVNEAKLTIKDTLESVEFRCLKDKVIVSELLDD